jgi:hypothetical protein
MTWISIQRWVYGSGDTAQEALRNLADELDNFAKPSDEYLTEDGNLSIVISGQRGGVSVGFCVSWKLPT